MSRKKAFTLFEIDTIKKLIAEKVIASPDRQKGIRQNIRNLGFYYSDFSNKKEGYSVADFDALIQSGQIMVDGKTHQPGTKSREGKANNSKPMIVECSTTTSAEVLDVLLCEFKRNRFDPKTDGEQLIKNEPGNYIVCLKNKAQLPSVDAKPIFKTFEGLQVVYTGIASVSLRTRDFKQHFKGNNAGRSTLRKSLGVLLGYKQIPRDRDITTGKTKFDIDNELRLSTWMRDSLVMFFLPTANFHIIEKALITHFNPPLNLKDNISPINYEFRKMLSDVRSRKV